MKVWCQSVDAAAIGKTQGTFDAVGTVTNKIGAKHVLGVIVLATTSIPTSAQNGALILNIDSQDLDISNQQFHLSGALTDGIATNDKEAPAVAEFMPFKAKEGLSLDNSKVDFSVTPVTTNTGGYDCAVGLVISDALPDQNFFVELMTGSSGRAIGGSVTQFRAGVKAATATAFTDGIDITSRASELIGLCGYANPNGPTANEAAVGITEFQASQIPDFAPQRWPFIAGWTASLGTPVGTPASLNLRSGVYWPTRFPLPRTNFEMSVSMLFATALTNEADGIAGAKWR